MGSRGKFRLLVGGEMLYTRCVAMLNLDSSLAGKLLCTRWVAVLNLSFWLGDEVLYARWVAAPGGSRTEFGPWLGG